MPQTLNGIVGLAKQAHGGCHGRISGSGIQRITASQDISPAFTAVLGGTAAAVEAASSNVGAGQ